ncbi:MAG TPA: hypothetical protein VF158_04160 [Longimicrobiales bacterium]
MMQPRSFPAGRTHPRPSWTGALSAVLLAVGAPAAARAQRVEPGEEETITIRGFVSATLFVDDKFFALSNGQSALWADLPELEEDEWFHGGDVRNTRVGLDFDGPVLFGDWRARATIEVDFFGGFTGTGAFSDEQPNLRLRLAYADLTNGRTTVRIGQMWSPTFGYAPESLSHIGFPLGWGAGGLIGWRFPGIFLYHDITNDEGLDVHLQLAAFRGSWSDELLPDDVSAGEATLMPQLEARVGIGRSPERGTTWEAFVAGHIDHKDRSGPGDDSDFELDGWAFNGGFRVRPGRFTLLGNGYVGEAIGQLFAQILQFGDFEGWGIQGQVGYDIARDWSVWAFYGIDDPDDDDEDLLRLDNQIIAAMLRYRVRQYAIGLEWFRAMTDHRLAFDDERDVNGNQFALSVRYDF